MNPFSAVEVGLLALVSIGANWACQEDDPQDQEDGAERKPTFLMPMVTVDPFLPTKSS